MDSQALAKEQCHFEKVLEFNSPRKILGGPPPGLDMIDCQELFHEGRIPPSLDDMMVENLERNKKFGFYTYPRAAAFSDKTVILVGSSPAVKKNIDAMREIDDGFLVIAANSVYRYLISEKIRVDFVFLCEAGEHICCDFKGDDIEKGLTLISSPFANTKALDSWKGDLFFYICGGGKKTNEWLRNYFSVGDVDIAGGNVLNTALCWANKFLRIKHFVLTGNSLCYYEESYHDGRITRTEEERRQATHIFAMDIYGNYVRTHGALLAFKTWLETYSEYMVKNHSMSVTNSTEDGILGVLPEFIGMEGSGYKFKPKPIPWLNVVPLRVAIEGHKLRRKANGSCG